MSDSIHQSRVQIRIVQGKESAVLSDIEESGIFKEKYDIAQERLCDIIKQNSKCVNDANEVKEGGNNKVSQILDDCVNNIIAFTGRRGQGKTTAMRSFCNSVIAKESQIIHDLGVIDPATFEDIHNIVEVVIARMYNDVTNMMECKGKNEQTDDFKKKCSEFLRIIERTYESISFIRNPRKFDNDEYDYEGNIFKISKVIDSSSLLCTMFKLVNDYLNLMSDCNNVKGKRFLLLQIDDIDVSIKLVHKMTEQLRKYLILPNIIIVMALRLEQLRMCIELDFRRQLQNLSGNNKTYNNQEPIDMALNMWTNSCRTMPK